MDEDTLRSLLILQMTPNLGAVNLKNLIAYCGSPQAVLKDKPEKLQRIPGIGQKTVSGMGQVSQKLIDQEIAFLNRSNVKPLYFLNEDYPQRLKDLNDAPVMMFYKGEDVLNKPNVLGIVGTRKATTYGRDRCKELIAGLAQYKPVVISGLAHGIDEIAHHTALKQGLSTVAVLGHGLHMTYPAKNENLARRMQETGGLLTEYNTQNLTIKDNFPARNRIIAGLLDGLIVVETGEKGGALITADVADSYNREVMAVPGRVGDQNAAGCHSLIKNHKAYLIEEPADVAYHLGWDMHEKLDHERQQPKNQVEQTSEEATILGLMADHDQLHIDQIAHQSGYAVSQINVILFNMELKGLVRALPGQIYRPA